jgi:hypothetical protein
MWTRIWTADEDTRRAKIQASTGITRGWRARFRRSSTSNRRSTSHPSHSRMCLRGGRTKESCFRRISSCFLRETHHRSLNQAV